MTTPVGETLVLVCYDIANNRRRYRVVRVIEGYGIRVQESVFECWLRPAQLRELQGKLRKVLHPQEDKLAFYQLTREDAGATVLLGVGGTLSGNPLQYYC